MDNSKIDSNIKLILDLRTNKGVFPLSSESAIIAHSPNGEMTYLDSVIDYLYQQIAYKVRLYTELDGNNTKGKAYPASMGLINSSNITSLQNSVNNHTSLLNSLLQQINNIDLINTITSLNGIVELLLEEFNSLMAASEYSYLEIKFSDSATRPPSNLDNATYWKNAPLTNPDHLWLGIRTVTVVRGQNGEAIVTKGPVTVVSLQGPKGEKGDRGEPGRAGTAGRDGDSYRPVFMYKWTTSKTPAPDTPTDPTNLGWAEDPGTQLGDNKYLWMTLNYQSINTNSYLGEWSTPVCLSGEDGNNASLGLMGPVVRFRGEYTPNTEYINSSLDESLSSTAIRYIDVVMIISGLTKTYYMVKPSTDPNNGTRRTLVSPTDSGQLDWEEATEYSFIAAEALYAQNAHIDNLSGYEFVVQDDNDHIVAGMTGGNVTLSVVTSNYLDTPVRIWAGSHATEDINLLSDSIPFKVFQDGKLKATDAEIKGDLQLDSLSLTGNRGSYYYNEEEITLPEADEYKHTVIFIITSDTATEVSATSSNVLFALSNNSMTTIDSSDSIELEKYKIYLAISILDGNKTGWLILNLNSLKKDLQSGTYCACINTSYGIAIVQNEGGNSFPSITLDSNFSVATFSEPYIDEDEYPNITNKRFKIGGVLKLYHPQGSLLAAIHFADKYISQLNGSNIEEIIDGLCSITIENLYDIYGGNLALGGDIRVTTNTGLNVPTIRFNQLTKDLFVEWDEFLSYIYSNSFITVQSEIKIEESFYYDMPQNSPSPVTTTTVGSNGLIIDNGIIVATDMPEEASVNMKDCIVYKDVTETAANEQYEVINFGTSNVTIGNRIVNPNEVIIIKAKPNIHIDFSDITAIDASDIYDTDPAEQGDPVNH